ncbi:hypothetical protein NDU88_003827 [Pleurodeles waltl]|uniref:Uncharacterized protein n=1 Tax=Pleurodeles waltl TaxID=8319 RepID=A0AAV7T5S4_PLEWA|nr:hypothetical protein NDU88_003827 [Pleurodeles waltl]
MSRRLHVSTPYPVRHSQQNIAVKYWFVSADEPFYHVRLSQQKSARTGEGCASGISSRLSAPPLRPRSGEPAVTPRVRYLRGPRLSCMLPRLTS